MSIFSEWWVATSNVTLAPIAFEVSIGIAD